MDWVISDDREHKNGGNLSLSELAGNGWRGKTLEIKYVAAINEQIQTIWN